MAVELWAAFAAVAVAALRASTDPVRWRVGPPARYRFGLVVAGGQWLSAEDAARYLRLPLNTIYRLVNTGQLPALRFPVRISREDLDGILEQCRIKPGALSHLNQYAGGATRPGPPRINNSGVPDRRYGPRLRRMSTP